MKPANLPTAESLVPHSEISDERLADASAAISIMLALVAAYTRDNHITRAGELRPGIPEVIRTAALRFLANPGQIYTSGQAGDFTETLGSGFSEFNLAEKLVLDRYRKKAI